MEEERERPLLFLFCAGDCAREAESHPALKASMPDGFAPNGLPRQFQNFSISFPRFSNLILRKFFYTWTCRRGRR